MYIILHNPDEGNNNYRGAIQIVNGIPYYVTNLAKPTLFKTEKEAEKMIPLLKKKLLKDKPQSCNWEYMAKGNYVVVDTDFYKSIVNPQ